MTQVIITDFYANWCPPCKVMSPIVDELATELTDIEFRKVNVDEEPQIAREKNIMGIPTFIVEKDGIELSRASGAMSKEALRNLISVDNSV